MGKEGGARWTQLISRANSKIIQKEEKKIIKQLQKKRKKNADGRYMHLLHSSGPCFLLPSSRHLG